MKTTLLKSAGLVFGIMMMTNISFGQTQNRPDRSNRPSFEELLKNMDADADGKLSKLEAKRQLSSHFAKVDTDEDGFITKTEFDNAPRPKHRNGKMNKRNSKTSFARGNNRQGRPSFEQVLIDLDADKDGKLSKLEAKRQLSSHFAKVDTDEDGFITKTEFDNAPRPKHRNGKMNKRNSKTSFARGNNRQGRPSFEQVLIDLDADKDGKLSKSEVKGPLSNHFAKVDTDEDGFITKDEFENAPRPKRRNAKMGKQNSKASFARGNNRQGRPSFEQVLIDLDADKDGKLSKSEAKGPIQKNFAKVDTDKNGYITKNEFDNMPRPNRPDFERILSKLDINKDGKLSKSEAKDPLSNHFAKVDTDEDGFITKTEFENAPRPKQGKGRR